MIDAEGILRFKGGIDDIGGGAKFFRASLTDAVNYVAMNDTPVSKNQKPNIQESVPYGCSVKYNYDWKIYFDHSLSGNESLLNV